jgi:hypothetical protein
MLTRQATENDFNFIASSYLKSYRHSPEARYLINDIYWDVYKDRLRRMLVDGQVTIASNGQPENDILGYVIVGEPQHGVNVLHYVYMKLNARYNGNALQLVQSVIPEFGKRLVLCTHTARKFDEILNKYKLVYNSEYVSKK